MKPKLFTRYTHKVTDLPSEFMASLVEAFAGLTPETTTDEAEAFVWNVLENYRVKADIASTMCFFKTVRSGARTPRMWAVHRALVRKENIREVIDFHRVHDTHGW